MRVGLRLLVNLNEIEYLLKLAVASPFIEGEKPVSVMLIAPPEHAKSELLKLFAFVESVLVTTDFNTYVFSEFALQYPKKRTIILPDFNTYVFSEFALQYPKKRTIILPDFLRVTKRRYSTQANTLTILNSLTEEGWIGKLPLGQVIDKPIVANVLTALTTDELLDKRHKWIKLGFLSRFLPVSFSYKDSTKKLIRKWIKARMYRSVQPFNSLKLFRTDVILPPDIADLAEKLTLKISEKENILGFRLQRQLQTLCMANAMLNNRNVVTKDDVEVVKRLSRFINYKFEEV